MSLIPEIFTQSSYGVANWIWIVIAILLSTIILKWIKEKGTPKFARKDLKKIINKDIKKVLEFFSQKLTLSNKLKLRHGYLILGNIKRMTIVNWTEKSRTMTQVKRIKVKRPDKIKTIKAKVVKGKFKKATTQRIKQPDKTQISKQNQMMGVTATQILQKLRGKDQPRSKLRIRGKKFYLIEFYKDNVIGKIKFFIGWKPTYAVIDYTKVRESGDQFIIDLKTGYSYFLGVFVFSKSTKEYVTDLAYKETYQDILDELINYIPKINYLEVALAGVISKLRETYKLEKEKYSTRTDAVLRGETNT